MSASTDILHIDPVNEHYARLLGWTRNLYGIPQNPSKAEIREAIREQQAVLKGQKLYRGAIDGVAGPGTHQALLGYRYPGYLIEFGRPVEPPCGVRVVNMYEPGGLKHSKKTLARRRKAPSLFVGHRGSERKAPGAEKTFYALEGRGYSTLFTAALDGTIFQFYDPGVVDFELNRSNPYSLGFRAKHCAWHNVNSDSIDYQGPYSSKRTPDKGQELVALKIDIKHWGYRTLKVWDFTEEQKEVTKRFVPWWCQHREIPLTACADLKTFRHKKGLGDPVTRVEGIVAHFQVSTPGARTDGALMIKNLQHAKGIEWREDFI